MGIFDFLRSRPQNTASVAKDRLTILVAQERRLRGAPDYLPRLRQELLEVIRKYVNVDTNAVEVQMQREGDHEVLALSVSLPEKGGPAVAGSNA